jgi:hypothetical protein
MRRMRDADANFIAAILAVGLALAINLIIFGVVWNTISNDASVLSENATYVLLTCFGGIIALLGSSIGYMFGQRERISEDERSEYVYPHPWPQQSQPITPPPPARPYHDPHDPDDVDTQTNRPDAP